MCFLSISKQTSAPGLSHLKITRWTFYFKDLQQCIMDQKLSQNLYKNSQTCCFELYFPIDRLKLSLQSGYARRNQLFAKTNRQTGSLETTQLNSVNSSSRLHVLLLFIQFLLHNFQNLLVLPIKLTKKADKL